jgi:hypothetical protein
LLTPWGLTIERASGYLRELLPVFTGSARQLLFEHLPGRGNPKFTDDYSAFDALVHYSDCQGRNGFVAFEIKYSESIACCIAAVTSRASRMRCSRILIRERVAVVGEG